jgi:type VI secretion system protein VasG
MRRSAASWPKINGRGLRKNCHTSSRIRGGAWRCAAPMVGRSRAARGRVGGKTPNLDQYTVNLTERAREGQLDPVLGRDFEVRQVSTS